MADAPLLVGIDAGTSRLRALVFTPAGRVLAEGSAPTPATRPRPGWAEQDAEALWRALCAALRTALAQLERPAAIAGLGIASVGEALVPLDAKGAPTAPVIAWYDERTRPQLAALERTIGADALCALSGLWPDPTFSLLKLLWLRDNHPEAVARATTWLNVCHYLAWRLTGVPGSDYTQASRSLAFDLRARRWATDLLAELGLGGLAPAPLRACGTRLGSVTAAAAAATGLPQGCAVGVGGHDHIIGALATGAMAPGVLLNSLGTAEALTFALPAPLADPELGRLGYSQGVVVIEDQPINYLFGGFPTSGACVEWFRGLDGMDRPHAELIAEAEAVPPGSRGVTFLPDLRGRLSPVPDPRARGAWFGLAADTARGALFRALLEGLAYESRQTLDAVTTRPGFPRLERIRAIGGNTRNALLLRIKAAVFAMPIEAVALAEATALGAALMGGLAAGLYPSRSDALAQIATPWRAIAPDPAWQAAYAARYQRVYKPAYAALAPLHHAADDLDAAEAANADSQ